MEGLIGALVGAIVTGPLAFFLGGRRERANREREFKLAQMDQTLEYILALGTAALTHLELSQSEAPFEALNAARRLPYRSPVAFPAAAQKPEFAEYLGLCAKYTSSDAAPVILGMSPDERSAEHLRLATLRILIQNLAIKERAELLRR